MADDATDKVELTDKVEPKDATIAPVLTLRDTATASAVMNSSASS